MTRDCSVHEALVWCSDQSGRRLWPSNIKSLWSMSIRISGHYPMGFSPASSPCLTAGGSPSTWFLPARFTCRWLSIRKFLFWMEWDEMSTRSWMRIWKGHCVTCKSMELWISSQKWQSSVSWGNKWKTWLGLLDGCSQLLVIIMLISRWSRKVSMDELSIYNVCGVKIRADWSSFLHQGASEINISCVIEERDADRALNIIHTCMFTFLD